MTIKRSKFLININELAIIFSNLLLIILGFFLPNNFLINHSYLLYGLQALIIFPYLFKKLTFLKNFFIPSFFILIFYSMNLCFGSYLIPRGYGSYKEYTSVILLIKNYNLIVPYLLLSNVVLFVISSATLKKLEIKNLHTYLQSNLTNNNNQNYFLFVFIVPSLLFFLVTKLNFYMLFAYQLAILIIIFNELAIRRITYRYLIYFLVLFLMVLINHDNKREVIIILFLICFLESYYSKWIFKLTIKSAFVYSTIIAFFFILILSASILRGYGGFRSTKVSEAVINIPNYIRSDDFIDGLTDNLELNYNYGAANTSMDMIIEGELKYQYGLTLVKVFFLPIPRNIFPNKPESLMQMYTKAFKPDFWKKGGSLPVNFNCDMFFNFYFFGLIPFAIILLILDYFYIQFHMERKRTLKYYSYLSLIVTVLVLARGSGSEMYILYFLFTLPVLVLSVYLEEYISFKTKKSG